MQVFLGVVMIILGGLAVLNALPLIRQVGRSWPREYTRGDAHNLVSSAFLVRWIGLLVALAGLSLVLVSVI